ncbi:MAG: NAD(P)-dependent oxidoreductase [Desulfobacca sp.]|uniref:NAD(P)-dependent oxidoreductase n=1 Tax=Desulfobacca sp. TaxID=2067990 RepID=UPI0040498961
MRLLIIGATRGIGRQTVEQALRQGHEVTVLARRPARLPIHHDQLTVQPGDILDEASVGQAMAGQEAVLITIGIAPTWQPVAVFSQGTRNVLAAMAAHGVTRLLAVTGIGAGDSKGHGGFFYDRLVQPLLLKRIYEDKDRQEAMIKASRVAWTIVRPGFLTNGPLTGKYRIITDLTGVTCGKISRADVAHFLLQEAAAGCYVGRTPLLTY